MTKYVRTTRVLLLLLLFFIMFYNVKTVYSDEINFSDNINISKNKINFQNINMNNGLSSNVINCIYQDSKGYIWIGTEDGLNQYDGNNVNIYNYEGGREDALSSTYITSIAEDENGYMWVGTYGGLNIIDSETEKVVNYIDKNNLSNNNITSIYKDSNNTMWVGTSSGLNRYDSEKNVFVQYYWSEGENKVADNYITEINEEKNGFLWVGTKYGIGGVNLNELDDYTKNFNKENSNQIYSIDRDINGDMWVASKSGVFKHNVINKETDVYKVEFDKSIENSIVTILCDINGSTWFGTSDGLIEYNEEENLTNTYKRDLRFNNSLVSNSIRCLFQDKNGVLWIGTDNGISVLNTAQQFSNKINNILKNYNITNYSITSIIEDINNDLWIGTESHGIINFIVDTEEVVRYTYDEYDDNTLSSNKIKNIFEIDKEVFLISTDRGVDILDKDTRVVKRQAAKRLKENYVDEIITVFNDGNSSWVGTTEGFYKSDDGIYELVGYINDFKEKGIENCIIVDIFQDEKDEDILWLAGGRDGGLIKFHKTEGVLKNYTVNESGNSISYDSVNCIVGDGKGNLWIGTRYGLNKFNIENETFINYLEKDGLSSDYINSIEIDDYDNLWLGTNNGLNKLNIENNKFVNFLEIDGIQGNHFNRDVSVKVKYGQILFGTSSGVVSFDPSKISEEKYKIENVVIGKVIVNGELISFDDKEVTLKYNENNLMFLKR